MWERYHVRIGAKHFASGFHKAHYLNYRNLFVMGYSDCPSSDPCWHQGLYTGVILWPGVKSYPEVSGKVKHGRVRKKVKKHEARFLVKYKHKMKWKQGKYLSFFFLRSFFIVIKCCGSVWRKNSNVRALLSRSISWSKQPAFQIFPCGMHNIIRSH